MIFNSFSYLIFFPVVTLLYFVLPRKIRWVWLLVSSYYFYMNWHAEYALLMAASTLVTYICALAVSRIGKAEGAQSGARRRHRLQPRACSAISNIPACSSTF